MTKLVPIDHKCRLCGTSFETDLPGQLTMVSNPSGDNFFADLQPAILFSGAIWEVQLLSCPKCGFTHYGLGTPCDPAPADCVQEVVRASLTAIARQQMPSIQGRPSLSSKYELYGLQLDAQGADDQLVGDQFLRAMWSARVRGCKGDVRRLSSLALERYTLAVERSGRTSEDAVLGHYLRAALYHSLGEVGRHLRALEDLRALRGSSSRGDFLINAAEAVGFDCSEPRLATGKPEILDFLGYYRAGPLCSHAYVYLREGDLDRASVLFERVLEFTEQSVLELLTYPGGSPYMRFESPSLQDAGCRAIIGLHAVHQHSKRSDVRATTVERLTRSIEKQWNVTADDACEENLAAAHRDESYFAVESRRRHAGPVLIHSLRSGKGADGCGHSQVALVGPAIERILDSILRTDELARLFGPDARCLVCGVILKKVVVAVEDEKNQIGEWDLWTLTRAFPHPIVTIPAGTFASNYGSVVPASFFEPPHEDVEYLTFT